MVLFLLAAFLFFVFFVFGSAEAGFNKLYTGIGSEPVVLRYFATGFPSAPLFSAKKCSFLVLSSTITWKPVRSYSSSVELESPFDDELSSFSLM